MHDHLIKATVPGVRAFAAVTTNLVEEARQRHNCYPVASAALGRTMTAALLLAANLKADEDLTIRIEGGGPLGGIVADARSDHTVRGYVKNPCVDLPLKDGKLDVGAAVGKGMIYITRFTGLKQPFTGSAPLVSGEIAEDITNYLLVSEQTPSSVALGVLVKPDLTVAAAGGFMIQALPGVDEEIIARIENALSKMPPVSQMIDGGKTAKELLSLLFEGLPVNFYDSTEVAFVCRCSRERVENMLVNLGRNELEDMLAEGKAEVACHFCAKKYYFDKYQLAVLLDRYKNIDNRQ